MVDPLSLALACVGLIVAVLAPLGGYYAGRRASIDTYQDLGLMFEKERASVANLRDEVVELLERITGERKRIVGERSRMDQTAQTRQPGNGDIAGLDREAQLDAVRARYEGR